MHTWIPRVIQAVKPWISTHGITKGSRWSSDIARQLDQHIYGIVCVTPENRHSIWLNLEAGALSKTDSSRTYTLLLGLSHAEVEQPLAQFNHTLATKENVFGLIQSINSACSSPLDMDLLQHSFEMNWPFLRDSFRFKNAERSCSTECQRSRGTPGKVRAMNSGHRAEALYLCIR